MDTPKNRAAVLSARGARPLVVHEGPIRERKPGFVVIKTAAVAMNPIDYLMQDIGMFINAYPFILGCDVAGTVYSSASDKFKEGDRVIGHANAIFSQDPAEGGFHNFVQVSEELMAKIPNAMKFTDAVVLPLGISTATTGLYPKDMLGLPPPAVDPKSTGKTLLVWGGSGSMGSTTIQLASASGLRVLTTASAKHTEYCKSLGAAEVFDHNNAEVVNLLAKSLGDSGENFCGVYDAIATPSSRKPICELLSKMGGGIVASVLETEPELPPGVTGKMIKAPWILDTPGHKEAARVTWTDFVPTALEKGVLKCAPPSLVVGKGLERVQEALDLLKKGVSGQKVVVEI